jgi:hypothetical protein
MNRRQRRLLLQGTVIGLSGTYLLWGLRGLATVVSLPIAVVVAVLFADDDKCAYTTSMVVVSCDYTGHYVGIALGATIVGLATAFPKQFSSCSDMWRWPR